jgi:2-C-methyl-D-erythritol 4-phosphate cytidylyltransferase
VKPGSVVAVIVAAGEGRRSGLRVPKQFLRIGGRTLLGHAIARFETHPQVDEIVVVVPPARLPRLSGLKRRHGKVRSVVAGGARRQDSVARGLEPIAGEPGTIVLVHDAARPLVPAKVIRDVIRAARRCGAAVPGIDPSDTVKRIGPSGRVRATLSRKEIRLIQTPQGIRLDWLKEAVRGARFRRVRTDDASMVEALGRPVQVVEGSPLNFKVTTAEDVERLKHILGAGRGGR